MMHIEKLNHHSGTELKNSAVVIYTEIDKSIARNWKLETGIVFLS